MKYAVKHYYNGIYWDNSYTDNITKAKELKSYMEDESRSIWDRVNFDALTWFIQDYKISNADVEDIVITAEIVEIIED